MEYLVLEIVSRFLTQRSIHIGQQICMIYYPGVCDVLVVLRDVKQFFLGFKTTRLRSEIFFGTNSYH